MTKPTPVQDGLPRVSVIMPVRQEGMFIAHSLGAVLGQDYPRELLQVIVVDGLSTDATRDTVRAIQSQNRDVLFLDNPRGIVSTGMNLGISAATGDVVIRVDGHCIIARDYVRNCVHHLQQDGVAGVGGPVHTIGRTMTGQLIALAMSSRFGVGGSAFRTRTDLTAPADTVPFPAYWRATIDRAGPYDEELVRNQDDEYNYRLRKIGLTILLASDVKSEYYSRSTFISLWSQFYQYGFWKVRVLQKHPFQMSVRQFIPPTFVNCLTWFLALWLTTGISWPLTALIATYGIVSLGAAVNTAGINRLWVVPGLFTSYAIMHLSYGFGFLVGLIRFVGRWGNGFSWRRVSASFLHFEGK